MERVMQAAQNDYYDVIVGAAECRPKKPCDLSEGIAVNAESNTVTFKLTRPDPEFLYKLALPFASIVPKGTPLQLKSNGTVPATGPYQVSEYRPGEKVRLERNGSFDPWAPAAQPDGYVNEIEIEALPEEQQVRAVREGQADVLLDGVPPASFSEVRTRFADQLYIQPSANTFYMVLNTREPPFDDVTARRAVNLAVDRERVAELFGGVDRASPTCQILPRNYPGYRRSCLYTEAPDRSGTWTAPDLARAQRLVSRSGTSGTRVEVWVAAGVAPPGFGRYFEDLLESLGYTARVRSFDDVGAYFTSVFHSPKDLQMALNGWFQDYPAPSNFFLGQYRCSDFKPNDPGNLSATGFCDHPIDRMIAAALRKQGVDPSGSAEQWAAIDRAIMEEAPVVPLVNLNDTQFVSDRVGNVSIHPVWGLLPDQVWVS
jgi:peptide/nickel transport system substrate-binding protein